MVAMSQSDSTCWTLVRGAAAGRPEDRETFARRYAQVIEAYLAARWRLPVDHEAVTDGSQEVFLQCFKDGGALERVDPQRPGGFRAFLYGVARNIAGSLERSWTRSQLNRASGDFSEEAYQNPDEESLSRIFDREWARLVTREARELMADRAEEGSPARERLRALELRYQEELASGDIAEHLGLDAQTVYFMLTKARKEFRAALLEVMTRYHPEDSRDEIEHRCIELLSLL